MNQKLEEIDKSKFYKTHKKLQVKQNERNKRKKHNPQSSSLFEPGLIEGQYIMILILYGGKKKTGKKEQMVNT